MNFTRVCEVCFSPAGGTRAVTRLLAASLAAELELPVRSVDFTLPADRGQTYAFTPDELVVFGMPTYAGRLPNKLLDFLRTGFSGGGAPVAAIVTFGGRAFDNSLAELCAVLESDGFRPVAGGAFPAKHAFFDPEKVPGSGAETLLKLSEFADAILERLSGELPPRVRVPGDPDAPYYRPLGLDGEPKNFLKAKPKTDPDKCRRCGLCAQSCPMGSISAENPAEVTGVCIKCHACVRLCPQGAKYFDDGDFLSHCAMLQRDHLQRRAEARIFL